MELLCFYTMKNFILFLSIGIFLIACSNDDKNGDDTIPESVDQIEFLNNARNIILNNYALFNASVNALDSAIQRLNSNPNNSNLETSRTRLKEAYLLWQSVNMFEFGPAESIALRNAVNVYSTDSSKILGNIATASFNLDLLSNNTAKGFPALDYLLHAKKNNKLIQDLINDANRRNYLQAVSKDIKSHVNQVNEAWKAYQNSFVTKLGTSVGSSTAQIVNSLNLHYEKFFRDNKIGVPLGVRSAGIARPEFSEAFYGEYSMELARANFNAIRELYLGNSAYGLDDYLNALGATDLNASIQSQLTTIAVKLNALTDPFPNQIQSNPQVVQDTYNEIQKLIVLWKVDLPSRMGVLITFQDNDGD